MAIKKHFQLQIFTGTLLKTLFFFLLSAGLLIAPASAQDWRFLKGYGILPYYSNYGTQGVAAAANTPGRKYGAVSWKSNGKFYLFGGSGSGSCDELWEYDPATNNWRWLKSSNNAGQTAVYGTQGIAAAVNTPGRRYNAVSWESNGKLYLFGGNDYAASGAYFNYLNDLWEYDPATNNWRWLKGSNTVNQAGIYGTQGIANGANTPGARYNAVSWVSNGKLYLFGGNSSGYFNDLWEYDPATNNWRWLKGSNNINQLGIYGTQGIAAATNNPGARDGAVGWESNGKLFLYGGFMYDAISDDENHFNDLWEYDTATNNWRWLKGSNLKNQIASYGTQGIATATNTPGARSDAVSWESNGKLYLFGGWGYIGGIDNEVDIFNDLWEYDPTTNNWRWLKGSNIPNQPGNYGTQGIAVAANTPGAKSGAGSWVHYGKLYLFGGGSVNDLWEYDPATNNWRWLKGSNNPSQPGTFGTQGIAAANNTPGGRTDAVSWESNGKLYLFGGYQTGNSLSYNNLPDYFNDLWEYDPATSNWRWLKGSNIPNQPGNYGTQGIAAPANNPGARDGAVSWECNGKLYLFGGWGYSASTGGSFNDLWEYDPATNNWRWLKGSNTLNQSGTYGTQGIGAPSNTPGARDDAVSWVLNGKLYLFGGGSENDLWEYDPATNNWRWLKGSDTPYQSGTYGTQGIAAPANNPGGRSNAVSWECHGKLYLFGGIGYAASSSGLLNDLWEYDPGTTNWRWLKGNNVRYQPGIYGTQGIAAPANNPGARDGAVSWRGNEKLYLFGGRGYAANTSNGHFNDLWEYDLVTNNWRWLKGSNASNQSGTFGTQGVAAPANTPGARYEAVSWESNGQIYLFGGYGYGLDNDIDVRGDLWAAQLPSAPNDVAVSAITSVNTGCSLSSQETITITVKNWSTTPQSNIPVSYKINNGTPVNEVITGPLAPNTSVSFSFTNQANLSATGTYNIEAKTNLFNDSLPANDSFTKIVTNYAIPAAPTVTAGGPTTFCPGSSVVLTATSTTAGVTYQWFNNGTYIPGATAATLTVSFDGNYTAVASANSCSSHPSTITAVTVNVIASPVITTNKPTTFCPGDSVTLTAISTTTGATFQWFKNGVAIPGATIATYTASSAGNYTAVASANGCPSPASLAQTVTITPSPATPTITQAGFVLTSSSIFGNQWYKDNVAIAGATAQTYTTTSNGSYTVKVTDFGCQSAASKAIVISTTGVGADLNDLNVSVHPNPSNGLFMITMQEGSSYELTVTDLTGKVIRQLTTKDENTHLDINNAAKGLYILKIVGEGKTAMRKLVVE